MIPVLKLALAVVLGASRGRISTAGLALESARAVPIAETANDPLPKLQIDDACETVVLGRPSPEGQMGSSGFAPSRPGESAPWHDAVWHALVSTLQSCRVRLQI